MKVDPISSMRPALRRSGLWAAALSLLLAGGAQAATHFIDFSPCKSSSPDCNAGDPCIEINAVSGAALSDTIQATDHGGVPVTFSFDIPPTGTGCSGTGQVFTCNGVTIDASSDPVTVSGTPTLGGAFSFALQANNGTTTCFEGFELIIQQSFDIVFVLDRSGSMSLSSKISPPAANRWEALKAGVNGATPLLTAAAAADSRFGLTLFQTGIIPHNSFPTALTPIGPGLAAAVDTELSSQNPFGATAMGLGLKDGMAKMTDPQRPRTVLLFTDGEQNVPPFVNLDGCTFSDGTKVNPTCPAQAGTVKIVTIGIGGPEADFLTTLQQLAHQNRGSFIVTGNGTSFTGDCTGDPTAAFTCALQSALTVSGAQPVISSTGTLDRVVTLPTFDLNRSLEQLLVQFSVNRNFEASQLANIVSGVHVLRDGSDITNLFQPEIVGEVSNAALLRGVFPGESEGRYTIRIDPPAGISPPLEFRVVAFADDHRLAFDWEVEPASPQAGEPFRPTVSLNWLGRPVTNANVKATILEPGDDLGDLLAKDPRKSELKDGEEAGSPGQQKYLELLQDPAFQKKLKPKERLVVLKHQGDGVYSAPFTPDVSGVYQILYEVKASNQAFGKLERQAVQSVFVSFDEVDLAASGVNTTSGDGTVTIKLRPKTTRGRFVGPANASAISVKGNARVRDITDHQDGSYTILLDGQPEDEISVAILGREIYRGPAAGFGQARRDRR